MLDSAENRPLSPIGELKQAIHNRFNVPNLIAELTSLCVISAYTGESRGVIDPTGSVFTPGLVALCQTNNPTVLQNLLRYSFYLVSLNQITNGMQATLKANQAAGELSAQISKAKDQLHGLDDAFKLSKQRAGKPSANAFGIGSPFDSVGIHLASSRQKIQEEIAAMESDLAKTSTPRTYGLMVDSLVPSTLDYHLSNSLDGLLFNRDLDGISLESILRLSPKKREQICLSMKQALGPKLAQSERLPWNTLGYATISSPPEFILQNYLNCREVKESGLRDSVILLNWNVADDQPQMDSTPTISSFALCSDLGKQLAAIRERNESKLLLLSEDAAKEYSSFQSQQHFHTPQFDPASRMFNMLKSQSCLKFALLYHMGYGNLGSEPISLHTVKRSIQLCEQLIKHYHENAEVLDIDSKISNRIREEQIQRVVSKVEQLGRASKRDLARTFHNQSYSFLEPLLQTAQDRGMIKFNGTCYTVT